MFYDPDDRDRLVVVSAGVHFSSMVSILRPTPRLSRFEAASCHPRTSQTLAGFLQPQWSVWMMSYIQSLETLEAPLHRLWTKQSRPGLKWTLCHPQRVAPQVRPRAQLVRLPRLIQPRAEYRTISWRCMIADDTFLFRIMNISSSWYSSQALPACAWISSSPRPASRSHPPPLSDLPRTAAPAAL